MMEQCFVKKLFFFKKSLTKPNFSMGICFYWTRSLSSLGKSGILEQHITGDVAFSLLSILVCYTRFRLVTKCWLAIKFENKNLGFFFKSKKKQGSNVSTFWASRVEYDSTNDIYNINGVIPPDEYHFGNNSVLYKCCGFSFI